MTSRIGLRSRGDVDVDESGSPAQADPLLPMLPLLAASQLWAKIVDSYDKETKRLAEAADAERASDGRLFGTYTMKEDTPDWRYKVYSGRTSGQGTLPEIVRDRYSGKPRQGFKPAVPDRDTQLYSAMRGREQQLHEFFKAQGRSANMDNPVWPVNPFRQYYLDKATAEFGACCPEYPFIPIK